MDHGEPQSRLCLNSGLKKQGLKVLTVLKSNGVEPAKEPAMETCQIRDWKMCEMQCNLAEWNIELCCPIKACFLCCRLAWTQWNPFLRMGLRVTKTPAWLKRSTARPSLATSVWWLNKGSPLTFRPRPPHNRVIWEGAHRSAGILFSILQMSLVSDLPFPLAPTNSPFIFLMLHLNGKSRGWKLKSGKLQSGKKKQQGTAPISGGSNDCGYFPDFSKGDELWRDG